MNCPAPNEQNCASKKQIRRCRKRFSSLFSSRFRLFVCASHALASGAFLSTFIKTIFRLFPTADLPEYSHFYGRFRQRNLPSQTRTHSFAFCAGFALFCPGSVHRGSAAGQAQTAVENTLSGCKRCRKEAALTGCSSEGKLAQNAANGDGALLRTNQIKHHKFDFEAHSVFFSFFFK